jgi:hypothetical protein
MSCGPRLLGSAIGLLLLSAVLAGHAASGEGHGPPGKGVVFSSRDKNLHCVEYGAGHVWCGFSTSPSALLKVDPNSLSSERFVFEQGRGLHDLSFDGRSIWAAHASGRLSELDPKTRPIRTMTLPSSPFAYTSFVEREVWVGLYTEPGRVLSVNRKTGHCKTFVIDAAPRWCKSTRPRSNTKSIPFTHGPRAAAV